MNNAISRFSFVSVGLALAVAGCKKSSTEAKTDNVGSAETSAPAAPAASPATEDKAPPEPPRKGGFNRITVKITGAYTAERTVANSDTARDNVVCTQASTILSVLHSGDAVSGDGNLGSFVVATEKYKGAGTYAFDDGSAHLALIDIKGEKIFYEDASGPATKTGTLTVAADGLSGSFKVNFGPGGDPPVGAVEVTGTFACPEIAPE